MIVNRLDERHNLITITPENPDDLWVLRRVIEKGDLVAGETTRVYKDTGEYSRPDKERIKVTVTLEVERIQLDSTFSRLRISGKIVDVSNEMLAKGSFHSLTISENQRISVRKVHRYTLVQLNAIRNAGSSQDVFAIVALDQREAGIGVVRGTHLQIYPSIESGATGKMYAVSKKPTNYFEKISDSLAVVMPNSARVFVLGPSVIKNSFANFLKQNRKEFSESRALEGSDVSGEDGVYTALRTPSLQEALGENRLARASKILHEAIRRISLNDNRVALALDENVRAAKEGAVESMLVTDTILSSAKTDEDKIVDLLNTVEELRGETFVLDSSTDLGSQVSSLGGVVGLLRFALK